MKRRKHPVPPPEALLSGFYQRLRIEARPAAVPLVLRCLRWPWIRIQPQPTILQTLKHQPALKVQAHIEAGSITNMRLDATTTPTISSLKSVLITQSSLLRTMVAEAKDEIRARASHRWNEHIAQRGS